MTLRHRRRPSAPVTATRSAAQAPTAINPAAKAAAFAPRLSRLALETRILFDGAAAVAADGAGEDPFFDAQPQSQQDDDKQQNNPLFDQDGGYVMADGEGEPGLLFGPTGFEPMSTGETEPATIGKVENTADDKDFSLGEDDGPTAVLKGWEFSGTGQVTVVISGAENGTLSHNSTTVGENGTLTYTGPASGVKAWLDGVKYQYKQENQNQAGDADTLKLTFTVHNEEGEVKESRELAQKILIAPQNDDPVVGKNGETIITVKEGESFNFGDYETQDLGFVHKLLGISDPDNLPEQVIIKLESIPDDNYGSLVLNRNGQRPSLKLLNLIERKGIEVVL